MSKLEVALVSESQKKMLGETLNAENFRSKKKTEKVVQTIVRISVHLWKHNAKQKLEVDILVSNWALENLHLNVRSVGDSF